MTPRPLFTSGKDLVPIVQEAGWAPGPAWTGAKNLAPTEIRSPDRPARSQSLCRLRYPAPKSQYKDKLVSHSCNAIFTHCNGVMWLRVILNSRDWRVYVNVVTAIWAAAGLSSLGIIIPLSLILHYCRQFQCSCTQSVILWNKSSQYQCIRLSAQCWQSAWLKGASEWIIKRLFVTDIVTCLSLHVCIYIYIYI